VISAIRMIHKNIHSSLGILSLSVTTAIPSYSSCQSTSKGIHLLIVSSPPPPPPQPFYGPFYRTTRVSQCQKRTSGLYGARED